MKTILFSAPSGSGKSSIIQVLMEKDLNLAFSISCTSRPPRGQEVDGVDYYFLSTEEFKRKIDNGEFIEYEEVYAGRYYGTLKSEIERLHRLGKNVILDIDVVGALNIKKIFGPEALTVFIMPPSIEVLRQRLEGRGTDRPEVIEQRLEKASLELSFAPQFDEVVISDKLENSTVDAYNKIKQFVSQ